MTKSDPFCVCCCRRLSQHNQKQQCPEASYFIENVAPPPTAQSPESEPDALREAVARVIDPIAFLSSEGLISYCRRQGDDEAAVQTYAERTYGPEIAAAYEKASAIIALIPSGNERVIEDHIETLIKSLRQTGEWEAEHEEILAAWRTRRGEAGKSAWRWWWKLPDDIIYATDEATRDLALAAALREEPEAEFYDVAEARTWDDDIDGDDTEWFSDIRNSETIARAVLLNNGKLNEVGE